MACRPCVVDLVGNQVHFTVQLAVMSYFETEKVSVYFPTEGKKGEIVFYFYLFIDTKYPHVPSLPHLLHEMWPDKGHIP